LLNTEPRNDELPGTYFTNIMKQLKQKMKEEKTGSLSRRKFIQATGLMLAATALELQAADPEFDEAEPIIDIHQHTNYLDRTNKNLLTHQRAMGITTTILLPAGSAVVSASTHEGVANGLEAKAGDNKACYKFARKNKKEFRFGACEVPDSPNAISEIEKYLKLGAVVIGELKFGVDCDSPEMQKIYQLAEHYRVPVLMHWQHGRFNYGFDRFHTMLKKYPRVNFIGHAQTWWANIDRYNNQTELYPKGRLTLGGWTDRYLSDYPNMYADLSAGSGLNALTRDEKLTTEFFNRHQDKLMYGSDCADADGLTPAQCLGAQTMGVIKRLSPAKEIERKLLYENAKKLFRV